jgi:hypothetical protein
VKPLLVTSLLTLALSFPAIASAQNSVSASYQYLNLAAHGLGNHMPIGFAVDYGHDLNGTWNLVGDFDWSRDGDTLVGFRLEPFLEPVDLDVTLTMMTFAGGPRWNQGNADGSGIYAQLLAGVTRTTSHSNDGSTAASDHTTDFMVQPGVGFALPFEETWRFIGGVDYRRVFSEGDRDMGLRLYLGIRKNWK